MSRNKKLNEDRFIYCGNIKCQNTQCLRNHIYEPWNVVIYEKKYKFDKDGKCDGFLRGENE